MKRNSQIAIRQPEATSLGRATSFNAHCWPILWKNLRGDILEKIFKSLPAIYINGDETSLPQFQSLQKVLAVKRPETSKGRLSLQKGHVSNNVFGFINAALGNNPRFLSSLEKSFWHMLIMDQKHVWDWLINSGWK
ncbi:hypothetical protein PPYR_02368 [Photinus pyralis]|uniref:Uncharacterized protein n=1 Tax=Photinus pyralis TaxID=7054 RepID=A0A5N4B762_PHOPY|nr:hypothetical protein PPYR_02368 [Photinus pyralis]